MRRQLRAGERAGNDGDEIGIVQLFGRHVDRDAHVLGPFGSLLAGGAHDPFADRADELRFLRDGDELGGRDRAEFGIVPAQQRLEPRQPLGRGVDDGLVIELQLAAIERLAQRDLEHAALLRIDVQLRLIGVEDAAAGILRPVQRQIGRANQRFGGAPVARRGGDAD